MNVRLALAASLLTPVLACSGTSVEETAGTSAASVVASDAGAATAAAGNLADTVVVQWNDSALQAIRDTHPGPPIVARALAMLHTSIFDAWSAYDSVAVGTRLGGALRRPLAERTSANKTAAISYAAYATLADLFPSELRLFAAQMSALGLDPAAPSGDAGSPASVGRSAASAVLSFRHGDGANQLGDLNPGPYSDYTGYAPVNTPDVVNDMYHWQPLRVPTAAGGFVVQKFITPQWSRVTPFALTSADQFRPGKNAVPAKNWGHYKKLADEVLGYSAALTDTQKVIAEYWADGPASELPPGHWTLFAEFVSRRDHHGIDDDAKMLFAMTNAVLDASIVCWDGKRFYDYARPITVVRTVRAGQLVTAWGGAGRGTVQIPAETWTPYQAPTVVTPPFPEFFSGHSVFSAAAAEVLKTFTGSDLFGASHLQAKGVSRVEPGLVPAADVTLYWPTFSAAADEAGLSRRYGGIHFSEGDLVGRSVGRLVGAQAWAAAQTYVQGTAGIVSAPDAGVAVDAGPSLCGSSGVTCCPNGVACIGKKCDARCSDCSVCSGQYCCAPNGNGHSVTCSATPSCN
jgi:hypothetical protein